MADKILARQIRGPLRWLLLITFVMAAALVPGCQDNLPKEAGIEDRRAISIKIAAASDVQPAFEELGKIYEKQTGVRTVFVFGSSGQISQQVIGGAKVDLYASADEAYVDKVISAGVGLKETKRPYALGRLVVISGNKKIDAPSDIARIRYSKINKIAIANPDHAPYGKAAREALINAGIWKAVSGKLVMGENARQTFQYAETGNVDLAFVPLSLARSSKGLSYYLIPAKMHKPITQTLVATSSAGKDEAMAFADLITSEQGKNIMKKYGFEMPENPSRKN